MADDGIYINRPRPEEYSVLYKPEPSPSNPVLRGLPLSIAATIISNSPFLQRFLWSNAGFNKLRDHPELHGIEPRYDPTVIKSTRTVTPPPSLEECISSLSAEDWTSKQPPKQTYWSTLDYHEAYKTGRLTPTKVVETLLPLIRRDVEGAEHSVSFLSTKVELVRKAAEESTARYAAGKWRGVLDGVPMAVKDEEDLAGYPKSLGSRLDYSSADPNATSFCLQQWLDAGAICIGKTTMHELGMDTTNCNPNFGTPRNPHNREYYCGGSSGGSAYAVAAGLVPFAMGNDGGGSVRIPASYCGVYGLKTSHGRVSIRPTANLAKSNGVAGPIAANMIDLELAYRIMAHPDPLDDSSALFSPPTPVSLPSHGDNKKKALGIFRPWFSRADTPVQALCNAALDHLTSVANYSIIDIEIPMVHEGQLAHAMTILAEIATGVPHSQLSSLTAPNKVLLSIGKTTPAVDFLQAQRLRHLLMQHLIHLFATYPGMIVVTPTTPNAGWKVQEADLRYGCSDGNMSIRNMEYVWLANFTGAPAISVPVGNADGGVPVGLMGMSEWGDEEGLIGFGYEVERYLHQTDGGRARPGNFVDAIWGEAVG